jgi:hypothetical protein
MFWTIFFAVFCAICLANLLREIENPFFFLKWFVDERTYRLKPMVKLFGFVGLCLAILAVSLLR